MARAFARGAELLSSVWMDIDPDRVRSVLDAVKKFLRGARQSRKDGWHIAQYDPNRLGAFPALRLQDGWELAAYHRTAGGNGRGMGLAVPKGTRLPKVAANLATTTSRCSCRTSSRAR